MFTIITAFRNRLAKFSNAYLKSRASRIVSALPILLPVAIATFGFIATSLLLVDMLDSRLLLILGLPATILVSRIILNNYDLFDRPGNIKEMAFVDLFVLIGVCFWAFVNMQYTSQNVFVNRDPAIYTVAGRWLVDNNSLSIKQTNLQQATEGLHTETFGFSESTQNPEEIHAQGLHLLPILVGLTGRAVGESGMLRINPIIGGIALLSVYGYGRLFMRSRWAAIATGVLALSLPMLVFSRDMYSEPLAMLLLFGSLALMWGAQKTDKLALWFIAGLTVGAGALTRIDAFLTLIAISLFVAIYLAVAERRQRRLRIGSILVFMAGLSLTTLVGWLDLVTLSTKYYSDLSSQFNQQVILLALAIMAGLALIILSWRTPFLTWLDKNTKTWRSVGVVLIILGTLTFLASRPLWYVSYGDADIALTRELQLANGERVDGSRDYAEQAIWWIAWYIGPLIAAMSVVGCCFVTLRIINKGDLRLLPGVLVVAVTSIVFLIRPSITPDQIWAARRFLPVVIPGLILFSAVALERIFESKKVRELGAVSWIGLFTTILLPILFISYPYMRVSIYYTQLKQVQAVCSIASGNSAVFWLGDMSKRAIYTTRAFCNKPSTGSMNVTQRQLDEIRKEAAQSGTTIYVVLSQEDVVRLPQGSSVELLDRASFTTIPSTLHHPPRGMNYQTRTLLVGKIDDGGVIVAPGTSNE